MRVVAAVLAVLALAATAVAAAVPHGSLTQPAGTAGCFVDPSQHAPQQGCATARGLGSTQNLALSPDQTDLYATSNFTWGVDVFRRSRTTGALTQLQCLATQPRPGCTTARGMVYAFSTLVSPDGADVYVSGGGGNAIAAFRRGATGRLTQLGGPAGCIRNATGGTSRGGPTAEASGCALIPGGLSNPRGLAISADGRFLYVADFNEDQITVLARDPATGVLSAPGVCAASRQGAKCTAAPALGGVTTLTVAPGGHTLYAASYRDSAVAAFALDTTTGALQPIGCVAAQPITGCTTGRGLKGAYGVAMSHDGRSLYAVARQASAIAVFDVDPQTGVFTQKPGSAGCLSSEATAGCGSARALGGVRGVTVSRDGHTVYTGAYSDQAIGVFSRSASGALHQLAGANGCVAFSLHGCTRGRGLRNAWAVTASSDGHELYTGVGTDHNSGLGIFRVR